MMPPHTPLPLATAGYVPGQTVVNPVLFDLAGKLGLREQTVKNYVTEILQKVGARNRAQAAALAVKHGWLDAVE